jgi:protein-S-isoprenylcysteine O-methyltransferase Ste14
VTTPAPAPPRDRAEIILLPPLIFLAGLVAGFIVESWVPSTLGTRGPLTIAGVLGLVAGGALGAWGDLSMKRAGTSPLPWKPTLAIVDTGPYRWTRNPLYLAQTLMHAGIAALGDSAWALAMLIPVLVVVRYGVIGPEEAYLMRKFGDEYLTYTRRVGRWIGPL